MKNMIKRMISLLPVRAQQAMKRCYFSMQIKRGTFVAGEKEFDFLDDVLVAGDCVIDVGANVGHYTLKMSRLVGPKGRVIAFEPVTETFELLAVNVARTGASNVTLINMAASDTPGEKGMSIPKFETGLNNYYMAHLSDNDEGMKVLCVPVDALEITERVRLVKVDAEGQDISVLRGMGDLIRRDFPILIVEDDSNEIVEHLDALGYEAKKLSGSCNTIYRKRSSPV